MHSEAIKGQDIHYYNIKYRTWRQKLVKSQGKTHYQNPKCTTKHTANKNISTGEISVCVSKQEFLLPFQEYSEGATVHLPFMQTNVFLLNFIKDGIINSFGGRKEKNI